MRSAPPGSLTSLVVTALAALLSAAPAGAVLVPGTTVRTLEFGGLTRSYRLRVPASYDGSVPVPLVLDIHGLGSNAVQQQGISRMGAVASREGLLVAYPEGVNSVWNAGVCCGNLNVDDVGFLRALVAAVSADGNVDAARVYATGLSNGGAMSQRLACEASDLFAATAPLAFPVPFRPLSECQPTRAIPVLTFMGLTDVLVRYDGGGFPSALETFAYWRDLNGCGTGAPDQVQVSGMSRCETYTQCTAGVQAGLCSITADSFGGSPIDGHLLYFNPDFVLADLVWAFLSQFRLPDSMPPARAVVSGPATLVVRGRGRARELLTWTLTVGDGTWAATDATDHPFTGSTQPRGPRGRDHRLGLTGDSQGTLLAALDAQIARLVGPGASVALAAPPKLLLRRAQGGRQLRVAGRLALAIDTSEGRATGRCSIRLRGPVAP
jgi:polyhydroxybutyrate depolymerase